MFTLRLVSPKLNQNLQLIRNAKLLTRDPGINKRKKVLDADLKYMENIEDIDDMEADFTAVHKSHKEYEKELNFAKEKIKRHIITRKYFKEKLPNFLSWNDKEQIKYLHSKDPEEWTVEKLSESFPALPDVINKVIRSKYTKSEHKVAIHDENVKKNWEEFTKGQMSGLPPNLETHLKKFTHRNAGFKPEINLNDKSKMEIVVKPSVGSTDFYEIIKSYNNLKKNEVCDVAVNDVNLKSNEKFKRWDGTNVTLEKLQENLERKIAEGKALEEDEKHILENKKNSEPDNNIIKLSYEDLKNLTKVKSNSVATKKSFKDYTHLMYPQKISIPKNILKPGNIYKLRDCYYDSDGWFLYRVPGMV